MSLLDTLSYRPVADGEVLPDGKPVRFTLDYSCSTILFSCPSLDEFEKSLSDGGILRNVKASHSVLAGFDVLIEGDVDGDSTAGEVKSGAYAELSAVCAQRSFCSGVALGQLEVFQPSRDGVSTSTTITIVAVALIALAGAFLLSKFL